jgi:hypothetical protein
MLKYLINKLVENQNRVSDLAVCILVNVQRTVCDKDHASPQIQINNFGYDAITAHGTILFVDHAN